MKKMVEVNQFRIATQRCHGRSVLERRFHHNWPKMKLGVVDSCGRETLYRGSVQKPWVKKISSRKKNVHPTTPMYYSYLFCTPIYIFYDIEECWP